MVLETALKFQSSARCTSAAPTYFEHYKHQGTGRIYTDGAMERNNPVCLADDERRFIWPKPSEHDRDVVISIGTGFSTNRDGMPENDQQMSRFLQGLRHLGIVRKIVVLKSVLQSTLNCRKMWFAFTNSLGTDKHLLGKCHRVDIPFGPGQSLCNLDDWQRMRDIKGEALKVLSGTSTSVSEFVQDQLHEQLDTIARQLVASLFYLTFQGVENDGIGDIAICKGWIRCRLRRSYEKQFYSLLSKNPIFRVIDSSSHEYILAYGSTQWDATFSIPVQFYIPRESATVRVEITLDNGIHWDTISGFPRNLHTHTSQDSCDYR